MAESPNIDRFLKLMVDKGGSDLHIKSGSTPKIRVNGSITDLSREILSPQSVDEILNQIMNDLDSVVLEIISVINEIKLIPPP